MKMLLLTCYNACLAGLLNGPCQAWISTERGVGTVTLTSHCRSLSQRLTAYRYELHLRRQGGGAESTNSQSGRFELAAGQEVVLSQLRLSTDPQTRYQVHLRIFNAANEVVAQDSVVQLEADWR